MASARDRRRASVSAILRRTRRFSLKLDRDARLLFWGLAVFNFGAGLYAYLFTLYIEELGATAVQIGLLVGMQGLLRIAVNLPAGVLAERYSRRWLIILTTSIAVPAVLNFAVAQEWWQLLPGMLLLVLGNLGTPAFSSYLAELSSPRDRRRAFSLVYVVEPSIALALSPVTGGWLASTIDFRLVFVLSGCCFAASTLIFTRLTDRPRAHHGGASASYREAIGIPVVRAVALLQFATLLILAIGTTLMTNYLRDVHDIGIGTIGWFGSLAATGSVILSLAVPRIRRMTTIRTIGLAPLLVGILCGVILLTGNPILLGLAFMGRGGFMVAWSLFASVLSDTAPPKILSRSFALSEFLGAIGLALAPVIAGSLFDWHRQMPLLIPCLATPLLAVAALGIERRYIHPAMADRSRESDAAI